MRKVKKSVLSQREFLNGLNEAFSYIIYSYSQYKELMAHKKKPVTDILNTNGRNVLVLLSSNTGLYGDIMQKVYSMFAEEVKSRDDRTDLVITGKLGKRFYDASGVKKEYKYFDLSDGVVTGQDTKALLEYLTRYTNVTVCHGVFKSIMSQEPQNTHVTGEVMKIEKNIAGQDVGFIFEPSVERVAEYFEKQILSLLFEQAIFESSLSKFTSRMVSLDSSASHISDKINATSFELKKSLHSDRSRKILENISGAALWI
jgi:F0F1-type ATP synthase gamma subunit